MKRRMATMIGQRVNGVMIVVSLALLGGCAQRASAPPPAVAPAVTEWLNHERRTIAIVALGPDQMMGQHWFEFDAGARRSLAEGPTMTMRKRRPPRELRDALEVGTNAYMLHLVQQAYDPRAVAVRLALAPVEIPLRTVIAALAPGQEYETVRPLSAVEAVGAPVLAALDKKSVGEAVRDRIVRLAADGADHEVRALPFEKIGSDAWSIDGFDTTLTVRIVGIGLWSDNAASSDVALKIAIWTHFARTNFISFEYKSDSRRLDDWVANDRRLLDDELDRATQNLAEQVVAAVFGAGKR